MKGIIFLNPFGPQGMQIGRAGTPAATQLHSEAHVVPWAYSP